MVVKSGKIREGLYCIRGRYVLKTIENNRLVYKVFNKIKNKNPKDFAYEVYKLSDLNRMLAFFEQKIEVDIFPNFKETDFNQIPQDIKDVINKNE